VGEAFKPTCQTYVLIANSTAPAGVRGIRQIGAYGLVQFQFMNTGDELAYIGYGATAEEAQSNSVIPTAGNPQQVIPVLPRCAVAHSFSPGTYFSAKVADAVATTILITQGEGS